MRRKIESLLEEKIRPSLAAHGGNVEIVDIENGILFIKLVGGCQGCSSANTTVKEGIKKTVTEHYKFITDVVDVTSHTDGTNPYM
ncbi:MAG: NifU family protein [Bdellovibrionales bacterium]|nr:NifU family protein [Bdellovibrionales bacterium]